MPGRRKSRRAKRFTMQSAFVRFWLAAGGIVLVVLVCMGATALMPKPAMLPDTTTALADAQDGDTLEFEPTPEPEPTLTPTPAVYAPFGAQYGHGGADLIPDTPTPEPTPQPTASPAPEPTQAPEPTAETYTSLKKGATGPSVVRLQQALIELGYLDGEADGDFGTKTGNAVVTFQAVNGLSADGIAGQQTQSLLYSGQALSAAEAPEMDYLILVNRDNTVGKDFVPTDLVSIADVLPSSVVKVKYNGTRANRTAVEALGKMLSDAIDQGVTNWQVSSAYRTYAGQQELVENSVATYRKNNPGWSRERCLSATYQTVAPAGTSEHQTGLAFDITVPGVSFTGTAQQKWLHKHCYEYGFVVRFTEEKQKITGFLAESWHIRYVGTEAAAVMTYNNWCLEEYVDAMM